MASVTQLLLAARIVCSMSVSWPALRSLLAYEQVQRWEKAGLRRLRNGTWQFWGR